VLSINLLRTSSETKITLAHHQARKVDELGLSEGHKIQRRTLILKPSSTRFMMVRKYLMWMSAESLKEILTSASKWKEGQSLQ